MKPAPYALAMLLTLPCACTSAHPPEARGATSLQPPGCEGDVEELLREREEANLRAVAANDAERAQSARGDLLQHQLDSLHERDGFEDMVWSRLEQAAIREQWVRGRLARAPRAERPAIQASLNDAATARETLEREVRRVRRVSDIEWPRYRHDLESAIDALEHALLEGS